MAEINITEIVLSIPVNVAVDKTQNSGIQAVINIDTQKVKTFCRKLKKLCKKYGHTLGQIKEVLI